MPTGKGTTPSQMPAAAGDGSEAVVKAADQLASAHLSDSADVDKCCASCGKTGDGLKRCTACRSVWYCGVQCQIDHRKAHKKECKRIKKELEMLQPHPPTEECPVCLVPLPLQGNRASYFACCGRMVCQACHEENCRALRITNRKRNDKKLPPMELSCAFCRIPTISKSDLEGIRMHQDRIAKKGDVNAMVVLAGKYMTGESGLVRDYAKALELYHRAADLGSPKALGMLGYYFLNGPVGVIEDKEKARIYLEDAAKKGDVVSRGLLGALKEDHQRHDLAIRHYKLAASAGDEDSVKRLWKYFSLEKLDKAELEETLRAHKEACDEMNSEERERYEAWKEAQAGNDDALKEIYAFYYDGLVTAKELKVVLKIHGSGDIGKVWDFLSNASRKVYNK